MFLSPPSQAVEILQKLHGQYVVVFATGVDLYTATHDQYLYGYRETGELYRIGGDESKVSAMIVWADGNQTRASSYNQTACSRHTSGTAHSSVSWSL